MNPLDLDGSEAKNQSSQDPLQVKQLLKDRAKRDSKEVERERLRDELRKIAGRSDDEFRKTANIDKKQDDIPNL